MSSEVEAVSVDNVVQEAKKEVTVESKYLPFEISMKAKYFKQAFGAMAEVAMTKNEKAVFVFSKDRMLAQMVWPDNHGMLDVNMSAPPEGAGFIKYYYNADEVKADIEKRIQEAEVMEGDKAKGKAELLRAALEKADTLSFAVKVDYIKKIIKRIGKKEDTVVTLRMTSDSKLVLSFLGKNYNLSVESAEGKMMAFNANPSARVMMPFEEWKEVIDDMSLELGSEYKAISMYLEVKGDKLEIKQLATNPVAELFNTTKGGDGSQWNISGEGKMKVNLEKMQVMKKLLADNLIVEFGTQAFEVTDPSTGEKKQELKKTPVVATLDDGYVRFIVATLEVD